MCDQHGMETASIDMSTLTGYARVSTTEQFLEMQIDVLKGAGYHQVFTGVVSGAKANRPGLDKAPEYLRGGDVLVVRKIDHLGRSLVHLAQTIDALRECGVGSRSPTDVGIDMTTRSGKLLFNLFATFAEFERDLISERTKAGLVVTRARGRNDGRRAVVTPKKLAKVCRLMDKKGLTVKEAAVALDVGHSTLYRALNTGYDTPMEGDEQGGPGIPRSLVC